VLKSPHVYFQVRFGDDNTHVGHG